MNGLSDLILAFSLCLPRFFVALILIPGFAKQLLGGAVIRNSIAAALALPLLPSVIPHLDEVQSGTILIGLIAKEAIIGLFIGFISAIPFWAIESAGFVIDNQRGASMASTLNPLSGDQTSPLGILFNHAGTSLFFITGSVLLWLSAFYKTFLLWPMTDFPPQLVFHSVTLVFESFSELMNITWRLAAPAVITMFLSEFGLGLMNRFTPQMNVFFLAMPIKSGIALLVLLLYISLFFDAFLLELADIFLLTEQLKAWLP
ncbi:type III secretion system export apparatus subunit SctT [Photobacterium alginatilyticum]|uniref:EscT/YscT/HrcT family type III secretion system export apparatus protein n=1 Tax=Photobacterium alginatilyticum TaxID=1775171 RepID=A0ABW9YDI9_9GAMM|nr:type III secretion system export apparatus subunit SctT [Photobacterium alginatilyticum]NBI51839.1 EscT/YscT/HrcT family type III secretion system export apparatus protein [Photobacterium alginatilyticum]